MGPASGQHSAGIPVEVIEVGVAGRTWRIRAATDQDALLARSDRFAEFPYGLLLWESAIALARDVAQSQRPWPRLRVLELGCGVGLPGLVARSLGARVTQSDHSAEALAVAQANAEANGVRGVRRLVLDWRAWDHAERYDVVLGSDLLYERGLYGDLLQVLDVTVQPAGHVLLADPGRAHAADFCASLRQRGWQVETATVPIAQLKPVGDGTPVPVSLITAKR